MKLGKRLLALLLVMAMLLSNLPVGAIAAELEEAAVESVAEEVLTETEPAEEEPETEEPEEETEPPTEASTEAPTEAPTEAVTEAPTEAVTEAATEEATEAATESATEAATEAAEETVPEETKAEELVASAEEAQAAEENPSYLTFQDVIFGQSGMLEFGGPEYQESQHIANGTSRNGVFRLYTYDEEQGQYVSAFVEVSAGKDMTVTELRGLPCADGVPADYVYTLEPTAWDGASVTVGDVEYSFSTQRNYVHFYSEPELTNENVLYEVNAEEQKVFYIGFQDYGDGYSWDNVGLNDFFSQFASCEPTDNSNIYKVTLWDNADRFLGKGCRGSLHVGYDWCHNGVKQYSNGAGIAYTMDPPEAYLSAAWLRNDGEGWFEHGDEDHSYLEMPKDSTLFQIFYLNQWDEENGWTRTPVALEDLEFPDTITAEPFENLENEVIRDGEENAAYFVSVTNTQWDEEVQITSGDAVGITVWTGLPEWGCYLPEEDGSINISTDNYISDTYVVDPTNDENFFYVALNNNYWQVEGKPWIAGPFDGLVHVEPTDNAKVFKVVVDQGGIDSVLHGEWMYPGYQVNVVSEDGNDHGTKGVGIGIVTDPENVVTYLTQRSVWFDENGYFEGSDDLGNVMRVVPGSENCQIFYLNYWDTEEGGMKAVPVDPNNLVLDDGDLTIECLTDVPVHDDQENSGCFVRITTGTWDQDLVVYYEDENGRSDEGVTVWTSRDDWGWYSMPTMTNDTFIVDTYYVNPDGDNVFYLGVSSEYWQMNGKPYITDCADSFYLKGLENGMYRVYLTDSAMERLLHGGEFWPTAAVDVIGTDGQTMTMYKGIRVAARDEDIIRNDPRLTFAWLETDYDEETDTEFFFEREDNQNQGTNLCPGIYDEDRDIDYTDRYGMVFYLNLWEDGEYVAHPVNPDDLRIRLDNGGDAGDALYFSRMDVPVAEGQENGAYFTSVSSNSDYFGETIWVYVEHDGQEYGFHITIDLHRMAFYSDPEMTWENYRGNYAMELNIDDLESNTIYLGFDDGDGDWTLDDLGVHDHCADLVEMKEVEEGKVWKLTLTQEAINKSMGQWMYGIDTWADFTNNHDENWHEHEENSFGVSRMNLRGRTAFYIDGEFYEIFDNCYSHGWFTGNDDEWGNEIWEYEVTSEWPENFAYDWKTNTLTLTDFQGESMDFWHEEYDWETGETWYNMPSDTLNIVLNGDNELYTTKAQHAFCADGNLNLNITGEGTLTVHTKNDPSFENEAGEKRVYASFKMHGGTLTIGDSASVIVEISGESLEARWDEHDNYIGAFEGRLNALSLDGADIVLKDNGSLETIIPKGAGQNGEEYIAEIDDFPGGARGIVNVGSILVQDNATLTTQALHLEPEWNDDGKLTGKVSNLTQTGGTITLTAQHWTNWHNEIPDTIHYHYEALSAGIGCEIKLYGGKMNITVKPDDKHVASSAWYYAINLSGGSLTVAKDAVLNFDTDYEGTCIYAGSEHTEDGMYISKLFFHGGTINAEGDLFDESVSEWNDDNKCHNNVVELDHECEAYFNGTNFNVKRSNFELNGFVTMNGGTITGWDTGFSTRSEMTMNGGAINLSGWSYMVTNMFGMNDGSIHIDCGHLSVNGGFALNNGEITIDNSDVEFKTGSGYDMIPLYVGTYFGIGGSEMEDAHAKLTIKQDSSEAFAAWVEGTMHVMDDAEVSISANGEAAVAVVTPWDENGNPFYYEEGEMAGQIIHGTFLMNGGTMEINNTSVYDSENLDGYDMAGFVSERYSEVFLNGGALTLNDAQLVLDGDIALYDKAQVEIINSNFQLGEYGQMEVALDPNVGYFKQTTAQHTLGHWEEAFRTQPGSVLDVKSGAITVNNSDYRLAMNIGGDLTLSEEGQILVEAGKVELGDSASLTLNDNAVMTVDAVMENDPEEWDIAFLACNNTQVTVNGGTLTVASENYDCALDICGNFTQTGGTVNASADCTVDYLETVGMAVKGVTEITGGELNLSAFDVFQQNYIPEITTDGSFTMTGGTINIDGICVGMNFDVPAEIKGGEVNVNVPGYEFDYGLLGNGINVFGGDNRETYLNISGGVVNINMTTEHENMYETDGLFAIDASIYVTGGVVYATATDPMIMNSSASRDTVLDATMYDVENPTAPMIQTGFEIFPEDGEIRNITGFDKDGYPLDKYFDTPEHAIILPRRAGLETTWQVNNGVLTFSGEYGGMYNYSSVNPSPWSYLGDFVTSAEFDSNLGHIGSYAFNGLNKLNKLYFNSKAPNFNENAFAGLTANAYYPLDAEGWTTDVMKPYGGDVVWSLNFTSVEVQRITREDDDVLLSGEKITLNAELTTEGAKNPGIIWSLSEESKDYASLSVKKNVATVTAKTVTEMHTITVYAKAKNGLAQPAVMELQVYPKVQSVQLFLGEEEVTGDKLTFALNGSTTDMNLSAVVNPNDSAYWADPLVKWESSKTAIADVDNGRVTFNNPGTVTITATANDGSKKSAKVTITAQDMVQNIAMANGSTIEVIGGKTASFKAVEVVNEETGETKAMKASAVTWSIVSDGAESFADITTAGKLTTKAVQEKQTLTIRASVVGNETAYVDHVVTVYPLTTQVEILNDDSVTVNGDTIYVDLTEADLENPPQVVLSALQYPVDDTMEGVSWKASSKTLATVVDGVVKPVLNKKGTAFNTGTVTITATADDGSKKSATVKVCFGVQADELKLSVKGQPEAESAAIRSKKSVQLVATLSNKKGLTPTNQKVTWSLQDPADSAYVKLSTSGKVTANTVYESVDVTVVATAQDGSGVSDTFPITVRPSSNSGVIIRNAEDDSNVTKTTIVLKAAPDAETEGEAVILSAYDYVLEGEDLTPTDKEIDVTWTPATNKYGTIEIDKDAGTFTFTANNKAGSVTVTAKNGSRKAQVTIKVVKMLEQDDFTLVEKSSGASENLVLASGKTMTLTAKNGTKAYSSVAWSMEGDGAAYATLSSSGKLTAAANLTSAHAITVTATAKDGSGVEASVDVQLLPLSQGIQIATDEAVVTNTTYVHDISGLSAENDCALDLSAVVYPANARQDVEWKSSSTKIANVDKEGTVTFNKAGTVTITATAKDGSGKKATFKLAATKLVSSIELPETAIIAGGKSLTLKPGFNPTDVSNKSVTWSMTGDIAFATLSSKGVLKTQAVTAPKTITVTATAQDGSGKAAECVVTIYPATTSVKLYDGDTDVTGKTLKLAQGSTLQLRTVTMPVIAADAYNWKSSNEKYATVEDGEVTISDTAAVKKTVTITATAKDGSGKKATVKITILAAE